MVKACPWHSPSTLLESLCLPRPYHSLFFLSQESEDEEAAEAARLVGGVGGGSGAKGEGHTAMVADILKEKERAESRGKEADAEAKGKGGGQVKTPLR